MVQTFYIVGGAIFAILGTLHLVFTLVGDRFYPRDPSVQTAMKMKATSPMLTRRTSMWNAWVGFNASHSIGAMVFGGVWILLASRHIELLRSDLLLAGLPTAIGIAYLILAIRYWFRTPLIGIALATGCFAVAFLLLLLSVS